jgi:hypothetical protein
MFIYVSNFIINDLVSLNFIYKAKISINPMTPAKIKGNLAGETKLEEKSRWPKILPPLTDEQRSIRDQFMALHLECMQTKWYGIIEKLNQGYP